MLGVENPRSGQPYVVADSGSRQMAAVSRHELDDQRAVSGAIRGIRQRTTGVQVDVQIAVGVVMDGDDPSRYGAAAREDVQSGRVVDAREHLPGSRAGWPTPGGLRACR